MSRYVCVHGHFYQPPRENPWLEAIESQDSAHPYHDWNERITAECYAQNAVSRILDGEGYITRIVNNYCRMSFNFGPTLLSWLEEESPETYRAILEADRESRGLFGGHGSAIAQAYNHMILPLANRRDRETQIIWGIRDFEHRFKRRPEGMWLPETAADLLTLDLLAEQGIRFTILSPYQARRVKAIGARAWRDASSGKIDPSMAYRPRLPSRRDIALFFYDGPISQAVAFEKLLDDGVAFADRILSGLSDARSWPQIVHIATDGESYGHHHRHGDMALAFALAHIERQEGVRLTNYGEFLELHPPTHEVELVENSSWSCAHGVERWKADCGCSSGGHPDWHQGWRGPLREALDWLRDELATLYEERGGELLRDPWRARNDYIRIILDRSPDNVASFFAEHSPGELSREDVIRRLKLLELQRHAMLMYTSCGWFFDELSGIETVQVIHYAGRAVQLAGDLFGAELEGPFLDRLSAAKGNLPEHGDGRRVYERWVRPGMLDVMKVAAHYAVSALFEDYPEKARVYCYDVERVNHKDLTAGRLKLGIGQATVASRITTESSTISYAALHLGDHNLAGGVREALGEAAYGELTRELTEAFGRAEVTEIIPLLEKHFGKSTFSLRTLFRDEQRKLLDLLLAETLGDVESSYRRVYERHAPLMRFLARLGLPIPRDLQLAAERSLNTQLQQAFMAEPFDQEEVRRLLDDARDHGITLDHASLAYTLGRAMERAAGRFEAEPDDGEALDGLEAMIGLARTLPFDVRLWSVRNFYYRMAKGAMPERRTRAAEGQEAAREWVDRFLALGNLLRVRIE